MTHIKAQTGYTLQPLLRDQTVNEKESLNECADEYCHDNYQRGAHDVPTARPCNLFRLGLDVLEESGYPRNVFTHGTLLTDEKV
jgi:hypothetical protein